MNFNELTDNLENEFEEHPDRSFVIKSLLLILVIMVGRMIMAGWFLPMLTILFINYKAYQCVISGKGIRNAIWENLSVFSVPRTTSNDRFSGVAWATWTIIIVNCLIFFCLETEDNYEFLKNNLLCLPLAPNLINFPLSFLSSMYLHADFSHLFGNMTFLWATGTIVERRIGWQRFLMAYHVTGLIGGALSVIVYAGVLSESAQSLGASGAISGVMGIYIVRCYFKKMILPLPMFGILPININIQMNAFAVIGLFFALDIKGGLGQLAGVNSSTGYWAHLGGMACGLWISYRMKLSNEAIEERHMELGSSVLDGTTIVSKAYDEVGGFANAEKSLMIALDKNPHNPETNLALARLHSYLKPTAIGLDYYTKSIRLLLDSNSSDITSVFKEFFSKYQKIVGVESQYRIASLLYREGNYDLASRTMEMLVEHPETPEPLREKSILLVAKLLEKMTYNEAAKVYYERFLECYPQSDHYPTVLMRLKALQIT